MNEDIFVRVENIFRGLLTPAEFETFHREATMDEVRGWDSLNFLEVIMAIEGEFGIRIDGLDAIKMTSVPGIVEFLDKQ